MNIKQTKHITVDHTTYYRGTTDFIEVLTSCETLVSYQYILN